MTELITDAESSGNYSEMNKYVYAFASQPDSVFLFHKDRKFRLLGFLAASGRSEIPKKIAEEILAVNPRDFEANDLMFYIYMGLRDKTTAKKYLDIATKNAKTDFEKKSIEISKKTYQNH